MKYCSGIFPQAYSMDSVIKRINFPYIRTEHVVTDFALMKYIQSYPLVGFSFPSHFLLCVSLFISLFGLIFLVCMGLT